MQQNSLYAMSKVLKIKRLEIRVCDKNSIPLQEKKKSLYFYEIMRWRDEISLDLWKLSLN